MLTNCWTFQNRSVQTFGFVYHDTNGQNHGPVSKTQLFFLSGICTVILWQDYYGKGNLRKSYWNTVGRMFPIGNAYSYTVKKGYSYLCMWMTKIGWKKNVDPMWKVLNKEVDLGEPPSFLHHVYLGCTQRQCEIRNDIVDNYTTMFESRISAGEYRKTSILPKSSYFFTVLWFGGSCKEVCGAILWVGQQDDGSTPQSIYSLHRWPSLRWEEMKSVGGLSRVCSQIVLKCWYLARIGRPDILWSVNKLARSITKWTKACDKRLNRLISQIRHTCEYKQYCHVGNTVKQCRLGLFQDSDFAGDLEDSKSTSGGTLCILGSHTFVPISWMCKKQTAVSHSSTESEIISLDAGLRLDGIPALELWDLIVSVLEAWLRLQTEQCDLLMLKEVKNLKGRSTCSRILIVFLQTSSLRIKKLCCMCSKTMKQWSRWSLKGGVPQWDMFPGLTELLLIGCPIKLIWTPKSKSSTSTPKTNTLTFEPKGISHAMSGIICWPCLISAISALQLAPLRWQNTNPMKLGRTEANSTRFRRRPSHSKIATDDESDCQDAVSRIVLDFSKPGEEKLRKSKSMEFYCWRGQIGATW